MISNRYHPHEAYKDSKNPWIGNVPSHWTLNRYKNIFVEREDRSENGEETLLSVSAYTGVSPKNEEGDNDGVSTRSESLIGYKKCYQNDLVINIMLAWNRGLGFSSVDGIVSPAYAVFKLTSDQSVEFLNYLVRDDQTNLYYKAHSSGVIDSRLRLYPDAFGALDCALPPLDEQKNIANFLNSETAKIDQLIDLQQKMLDLLDEKRKVLALKVVTRGLNVDAKLRDSGVEWLGDIPSHWDISQIKHIASLQSGDQITGEDILPEGDYPVYGGNGLRGFTDKFTHEGFYPLIGRQGALCGNINYANGTFWASEHAVVVSPFSEISVFWLGELLRSMNLGQYSVAAAQPGLSVDAISRLKIPVPPKSEQLQIAEYLKIQFKEIEDLGNKSKDSIRLLKERRASLIWAAVTGKIDVRNLS